MNNDKLLNLAGAKVLYDDLRDRIDQASPEGVVRYDTSQDLTAEQQEQARDNINAADIEQIDAKLNNIYRALTLLAENNSMKLCADTAVADKTDAGITFTWTGNAQCTITGTSSSSAATSNSCATARNLPTDEIKVGGTYFIRFKSTGTKSCARAEWWIDNPGGFPRQGSQLFTGDAMFTVPAGATSLYLEAHVPANSGAVNETVEIGIYSAPTNLALWEAIQALS